MTQDVEVDQLVRMFEAGRIDRRRLLGGITALLAAASGSAAQAAAPAAAAQAPAGGFTPAPGKGVLELSAKGALQHVELKTIQTPTSLAKMRDFYQALFGVPAETRKDRVVLELPGGSYISIGWAQTQTSIDHFGFGVVEDAKTIVLKLKAAGYRFDQPRDSFITDPDGRQIQIVPFTSKP